MNRLVFFGVLGWLSVPGSGCCRDFHLWLEIRPVPRSCQAVRVEVDQLAGYAARYRVECPGRAVLEGELGVEQGERLQARLDAAGVWELGDGDELGAESCVYYTTFDLTRGDSHQHSQWRGLPPAQARVAAVFLQQPQWAQSLRAGLDWNQSQK